MQNNKIILKTALIIIFLAIVGLVIWFVRYRNNNSNPVVSTVETFDQSISDGTIKAVYSSGDFALAVNPSQVLAESYIPPCMDSFDYCFYYTNGNVFAGTNFDSAGLSIKKRPDLKTEKACMEKQPTGYANSVLPNTKIPKAEYSTAIYEGLGNDAATGHVAEGSIYRLFYKKNSSCYELLTRVSYSQFGNYEPGTIEEFTEENKETLKVRLENILSNISVPSGDTNIFP